MITFLPTNPIQRPELFDGSAWDKQKPMTTLAMMPHRLPPLSAAATAPVAPRAPATSRRQATLSPIHQVGSSTSSMFGLFVRLFGVE
jgi:hypothetical protein